MEDKHRRLLRYAFMRLARDLDLRFTLLLKTGRVAKWYSQIGTEATSVAAGLELERRDVLCSLHRDLGAILAYYLDPARAFPGLGFASVGDPRPDPEQLLHRLCCQLLGRADGFSGGIERSFHYSYLAPEAGIRHVGMISHLGAMIPVAAGCAFGLKRAGEGGVAINFIGDGGTSTGDFHEGLNMAAVWKLPLVLVVENNRYAFSTPTRDQYAAASLADRGPGYGVAAQSVDGNDPDAMAAAIAQAVARARAGEGPTLLEAMLGRMRGHSEGDDSLKVVPENELASYMDADPVPTYAERLRTDGILTEETEGKLDACLEELIEGAVASALDAPQPEAATALQPSLVPWEAEAEQPGTDLEEEGGSQASYVEGIHQALWEALEEDPSVLLMGQDIARFEGAFRITKGMWQRWPDRVLDTPIAESGTLGIAAGLAILGYRPVVEMQFGDFITCGFNQVVNVIAKLYYRWRIPCPLVIRLPVGGGVGAGPFHSQNPEAWFAHVAGLKVVCPATAEDAKLLLSAAIRDPNPVIFCEHKYLYRRIKGVLPKASTGEILGRSKTLREGGDLSLIAYGASVWTALEAAEKLVAEGVAAEVIDLRTLIPLDTEHILDSVRRTGRALIVHEAQGTGGFGGEIAARISELAFPWLDAPVVRVAHADRPSPFSKVLEQNLLPGVDKVLAGARELLAY